MQEASYKCKKPVVLGLGNSAFLIPHNWVERSLDLAFSKAQTCCFAGAVRRVAIAKRWSLEE
jgi:hypothetical protein